MPDLFYFCFYWGNLAGGWHGSALLKAAVPLRKCNKNRGGVNYAQAVNGFCSREVDDMDVRQTDLTFREI